MNFFGLQMNDFLYADFPLYLICYFIIEKSKKERTNLIGKLLKLLFD